MSKAIHTSDSRLFKRLWQEHGGFILAVSGTGEVRYVHPAFASCIRANDRRKDVPAKLLTRLNALIRHEAANDSLFAR
jgi:hypothetical protein